jgi:hypothetical protein
MVERRAFAATGCGVVAAAVAIAGSPHGARARPAGAQTGGVCRGRTS